MESLIVLALVAIGVIVGFIARGLFIKQDFNEACKRIGLFQNTHVAEVEK